MLWGGWGERKRERAGHDGKGEERREAPAVSLFPSFLARFLFLSIIDILMGIPSGSLCGGESVVVVQRRQRNAQKVCCLNKIVVFFTKPIESLFDVLVASSSLIVAII